jgi:hypothetical protein
VWLSDWARALRPYLHRGYGRPHVGAAIQAKRVAHRRRAHRASAIRGHFRKACKTAWRRADAAAAAVLAGPCACSPRLCHRASLTVLMCFNRRPSRRCELQGER